jgi:hypothetical protein
MSVSIYVNARKELSREDADLIRAYMTLTDSNIQVPKELGDAIVRITGKKNWYDMPDKFLEGTTVELPVNGDGDVMYGDGMILRLKDLPEGTKELRIYAF